MESRRRPLKQPTAGGCTVYLDECGQHALTGVDAFPVFVLSAVVIRKAEEQTIDAKWKQWKRENLGSDAIVHEPDIRRDRIPFKGESGRLAVERLPDILKELDFAALGVVVNRADYIAAFGTGPVDESLPDHVYLMALDFLMERLVFVLDRQFGGSRATIVAESRGPKEDALLQHEFSRLHLDGTSYISPGWFRQQLDSGIRFYPKTANLTGLQLADLLARPLGEKVANPESEPERWRVFRDKLCTGVETKHSVTGLKIVPWHDKYKDLWKS